MKGLATPAYAEAGGSMQMREGTFAGRRKELAGIEERRELEAHLGAESVERRDARAQLHATREHSVGPRLRALSPSVPAAARRAKI
jgi:hypothetical protein